MATIEAVAFPPDIGRARLRGDFVARNASARGRYWCNWQGIWDYQERRVLDLSNPFESSERWRGFNSHEKETARDLSAGELGEFQRVLRTWLSGSSR